MKLLNGDCLELMENIPDKSINFILTDLPYGTTRCQWDSIIDLDKLWGQYNRIIKNNGCIALFAAAPFDKVLAMSNLDMFRYEWIWEKTRATGHFNAKKMPMKAHENILIFYKNLPTYNPQMTTGHKPVNSFTKKKEVADKTEVYGKNTQTISGGGSTMRYPRSVLKFSVDTQKSSLHPTQKPLELCEYFVKTYTNEGDTVLDSCMGSGTTGVACKNLNREFVGIELDEDIFNIAKNRIENSAT